MRGGYGGRTGLVRGAVAGAVAAGVWAAVEPALGRALRTSYTDVRFLGRFLPTGGAWPAAGLAWHVANGAAFGAVFGSLGGGGWKRGLAAAQAENALTYPLLPVVARRHPDYRSVQWAGPEGRRILVQETILHALYGAVLGGLTGRPEHPAAPPAPVVAAAARMPFEFDPRYRRLLRLIGERGHGLRRDGRRGPACQVRAVGPRDTPQQHPLRRSPAPTGPAGRSAPGFRWPRAGPRSGRRPNRVCVEFHVPVRGKGPMRLVRLPNLTVTVRDPEALVATLSAPR